MAHTFMPFSQFLAENDSGPAGCEASVDIVQLSLPRLRTAIQSQQVSFPSQIPIFTCQSRADIQWRLVELYFVHNWSCAELGERYNVAMERIRQLIVQWVRRAMVLGYLQEIPSAEEPAMTLAPMTGQSVRDDVNRAGA
jgi:hypothetical protein